jgi:glycosyltransferase involved in cell wall biosynthesis
MPPTVSINLCCYNSEKFLEATLQSIFAQTYKDWELVIVNDGSQDSTEQIVQKHIAAGWPIVYYRQANAGLSRSRNQAIELSRGGFIALIDHDDLWEPTKLEKQMTLFAGQPRIGLTFTDALNLYPNGATDLYSARLAPYRGSVLIPLLLGDFIVCSTVVVRRAALAEVGVFNPNFKQAEEYDLMLRLAERYEFDYVAEPLATYRWHDRNSSTAVAQMQQEVIQLVKQTLQRAPQLRQELGPALIRVKMRGLYCTQGQAYLLQGRWVAALKSQGGWGWLLVALPKTIVLFLLSFFPPDFVVTLTHLRRTLQRWFLLRQAA